MKYSEALKWIETHKDIIGSIDEKGGFIVSDLLIVPTNSQNQDTFLRNYLLSRDKESAILPYINDDVEVWSVDLSRIESCNLLSNNKLAG